MGDIQIFASHPFVASDDALVHKKKLECKKTLRKKLKVVAKQNETLEVTLTHKNTEISELKKAVQSLNDVINSVPIDELKNGSSIASSKIIELSKKNRALKTELESLKNKNAKLEAKIQKLEVDLKASHSRKDLLEKKSKTPLIRPSEALQEQMAVTKQKLFEQMNQNTELRNALKLAQKCIQQEIGDNVNLNLLAAANTNWRGRAQQIIQLQGKVKELNEKLEAANTRTDDPSRFAIRKLESTRRAEIDELQNHIHGLNSTIDELKVKISALKLRNKHLVEENSNCKMRAVNLLEQSGVCDSSLSNMHEQFHMQKMHFEARIKELLEEVENGKKNREDCELNNQQLRLEMGNLRNVIAAKEDLISSLNESISRLEGDLKAVYGDYLFSCRDFKKSDFVGILDALEVERNGLLVQNTNYSERLNAERAKTTTLSEIISKQKIKISRLEGKIRDFQKEQEMQLEKHRRNQRVTEYSNSLNSGRLPSIVFENSSCSGLDAFSQQSEIERDYSLEIEQLKNSLEFSNEKIAHLEEKLGYIAAEHEADAKLFKDIIHNSKNTLLDTIHGIKDADPTNDEVIDLQLN